MLHRSPGALKVPALGLPHLLQAHARPLHGLRWLGASPVAVSMRSVLDPAVRQGPGQVAWAICAPISEEHQQSLQVRCDSVLLKPASWYGSVLMTMQHSCRLRAGVIHVNNAEKRSA